MPTKNDRYTLTFSDTSRTAAKGRFMKRDIPNYDKKLALIVLATLGSLLCIATALLFLSIWAGV